MKKYLIIGIMALLLAGMVSAADCEVTARNTDEFLKKVPELNSMISSCNLEIPSPANRLFGNDIVNIQIVRANGSKDNVIIKTEDSSVKTIGLGYSENPTYVATIADCALDNVLASDNKAGALAYLYNKGHLTIGPRGFLKAFKFRLAIFFAKSSIKKIESEVSTTCSKKRVGEVCVHGGECETGNCIGIVPGQLYKCSCDPFKYVDAGTDGNCPPKDY